MDKIKKILKKEITKKGHISISRFMEISLFDPNDGYYTKQNPLGSDGDFITSPDISQIFGEVIGAWALDIIIKIDSSKNFQIIDLGGGKGTLLKDIKRVCKNRNLSYGFIDINRSLIDLQKKNIPQARHFNSISQLPSNPTIFIGNEFLDVFPIRQFMKINEVWQEVFIKQKNDDFQYCYNDIEDTILFNEYQNKIPGNADFFEINIMFKKIINDLSIFLKKNNGICLFIDYGYLNGYGNTLQAIKKHKYVDPLAHPGISDITSHVNFSHLMYEAKKMDLNFFGPVSQRNFLIKLGAFERLKILKKLTNSEKIITDLEIGLKRVIENTNMGSLFKVCAITPNRKFIPEGFD